MNVSTQFTYGETGRIVEGGGNWQVNSDWRIIQCRGNTTGITAKHHHYHELHQTPHAHDIYQLTHTHSLPANTGNTGSGTAFSIIPPYQAVYTWYRSA